MKKIAFIGAGSLQFTSSCVRDLLTFPAFEECEFALMDINPQNLANIEKIVKTIIEKMNKPKCKVSITTDRAEALRGADGVLCTVFNGDIDIWQYDIIIPKKIRRGHKHRRHTLSLRNIPRAEKYPASSRYLPRY